ncbi:hypothetical protein AGDE_02973 [Angomonas deanei]|uniref:Uncharacterized protein n=1 Tax=Angomonas deanei TaxID=59799 RepID=S9VEI0_9TRYP|nr:hypothetical protein AGDE_05210 [Angomonas deanei]EPY39233.1 hypothetical protein AGDE_04695 [Angomonas deanei]EPY40952.1 hypothetical protein AGDE_02973 [Angomonas deanei]CAD2217982.1 hypothetical protein, conserved [Angomonas deanei]|eukprot:EPY38719.1 hypothetical protein AGDE_05210 [Angomonas deanei]
MPNLCVSCTFNPPVITVLGSYLRDDTIRLLEHNLVLSTSTSANVTGETPKFVFFSNPDYWKISFPQHFCDELHKSIFISTIMDCLSQEGWILRASNTVCDEETEMDTSKLFFTLN